MRSFSLFSLSLLVGCSSQAKQDTFPSHTAGANSYLALGDSYTIGTSVEEPQRWPVQLVHALRKEGVTIDDPMILARNGWRTDELEAALDQAKIVGPFRLVSLLIGVNDQYGKQTPEGYRPRFAKLLERSIALAGGRAERVLVLSIPDYDYGPPRKFAPPNIGDTIDRFNQANREETERRGAVYVDVTALSRRAVDDEKLWASDRLHFSGEMYRMWVEAMTPRVKEMLK
jgi:lysophospholipase L1-like esterase